MTMNIGKMNENVFDELKDIFNIDIALEIVKQYNNTFNDSQLEDQIFKYQHKMYISEGVYKFTFCTMISNVDVLKIGEIIPVIIVDFIQSTITFYKTQYIKHKKRLSVSIMN